MTVGSPVGGSPTTSGRQRFGSGINLCAGTGGKTWLMPGIAGALPLPAGSGTSRTATKLVPEVPTTIMLEMLQNGFADQNSVDLVWTINDSQ